MEREREMKDLPFVRSSPKVLVHYLCKVTRLLLILALSYYPSTQHSPSTPPPSMEAPSDNATTCVPILYRCSSSSSGLSLLLKRPRYPVVAVPFCTTSCTVYLYLSTQLLLYSLLLNNVWSAGR